MSNPIEPAGRSVASRHLPALAARPGRSLVRGIAAVAAWARLRSGALRFGEIDGRPMLDPQRRALVWPVFVETIAAIGALAARDGPPEAGIAALTALAERLRERVAAAPPRLAVLPDGADPPQLFILQMLGSDLQPCLARWQPRLAEWCGGGRSTVDWPLLGLCRGDLEATRARLAERGWQLGIALDLPDLGRLLPERSAAVPQLLDAAELAAAEAGAAPPPDPASAQAGWRIYVEAVAGLPAAESSARSTALGEAIAALERLAAETRSALKAMPPLAAKSGTIRALAFALLTEGLQPFLGEWRGRWQKFATSGRPAAKWRRAEECRVALAAARERCLPIVKKLGRELGAPPAGSAIRAGPSEETPLQLPPPATRS